MAAPLAASGIGASGLGAAATGSTFGAGVLNALATAGIGSAANYGIGGLLGGLNICQDKRVYCI